MDEHLAYLLNHAIGAITDDRDADSEVALLIQLLRRFQQEQAGFLRGNVDRDILEIWGSEAHAIRVDEIDVREIIDAVAQRSEQVSHVASVAVGVLATPEVDFAVDPILRQLARLDPDSVPRHDLMASALMNAMDQFMDREDVRDAIRGFIGRGDFADDTARSLAEEF